MIQVEMSTALIIYLGLALGLCFGIWLHTHKKTRKKQPLPPLHTLVECEYCHFSFLGESVDNVSKCPQCHSLNHTNK